MKQILIFGSGMMSSSLITCLTRRPENNITLASNILSDAEKLCSQFKQCTPVFCDVSNEENLKQLIEPCDIVISFVPPPCHPLIAKVCLKFSKNLVTSSYISPAMKEMDQEVKEKGLIFLNECGLDPGLDHIVTMKLLEDMKSIKAENKEFISFCGGLPSPDACDNCLGYKFSWSPIGMLNALRNNATYLKNNMEFNVPSENVLYVAKSMDINMTLRLEGYPNRDSTKYVELYGLQDFETVQRGTLRYEGYSFLMAAIVEVGFLKQEVQDYKGKANLPSLIEHLQTNVQVEFEEHFEGKNMIQQITQVANNLGIKQTDLALKVTKVALDNKHYHFNETEFVQKSEDLLRAFQELGFFDESVEISLEKSPLDNLCKYFEKRLAYKQGEKDAIVLQNVIRYKVDGMQKQMKGTLIMMGGKNGLSAMALTVGGPSAIAAQLILDNKISLKGVHMPNQKEIWQQMYEKLSDIGIDIKITY